MLKKLLLLLLWTLPLAANDLIPGTMPDTPVAIIHARIFTVSNGIIEDGTLVFDQGRITAVGRDVAVPENAAVIDAAGGHLYPGLIAGRTSVGLVEVGAVRASRDVSETGLFNPNARAETAYNTDSEVTPTVRSNGVALGFVAPAGGRISGMGALIYLDGWNRNDAVVKSDAGMILNWPPVRVNRAWWNRIPEAKQLEQIKKSREELERFFDEARAYANVRAAGGETAFDIRYDSMIPVLEGRTPLVIRANDQEQIRQAVAFCAERGLKMILLEGADSWKVAGLLREQNVPVILRQPHSLPAREDEDYDQAFKTAAQLARAGVSFALTKTGTDNWDIRNLPFWGATMVSFGLSREDALRALTLWPAQMFGVADRLGSLETGREATLFLSRGDVMDYGGNAVTHMFIGGRPVDLDNRQKRLYRKYSERLSRP